MNRLWQHAKRGGTYAVIAQAELQASGGAPAEGDELTVYVGLEDGKQWVRPRTEFEDGRFICLDPAVNSPAFQQQLAHFARVLVEAATAAGMVVTIEQRPLKPLAMRHYETVVDVRPAR